VLASGSKVLVPVEVTEESQALIAILCLCHAWRFLQDFPGSSAMDPFQAFPADLLRLRADFHGLKACATGVACQALWMETLSRTCEPNKPAFDRKATLMTESRPSVGRSWSR